jgi:membrane protease YdiL (CAAX protease family)
MKQIITYIQEYFGDEWNPKLFLTIGVFLAGCFFVNYGFDFERRVVSQLHNPVQQFLFYFLFCGIPFAFTVGASVVAGKRVLPIRREFYLLYMLCFVLLAVYITLHNVPAFFLVNADLFLGATHKPYDWYLARYISNLLPGVGILIPLLAYWLWKDRVGSRFYGFSSSNINLRTYFVILLFLVPIVFLASLNGDFQATYPRYRFGLPQTATATEQGALVGLFELCYGVDFVFVELFFRGFMVMAFSRYLGSGSILPMVVVYAFIHFQKPIGEAIGSVVGGLVLGVISYRTRSIYGGIILHLGVAYLMEIAGTMQMLLR